MVKGVNMNETEILENAKFIYYSNAGNITKRQAVEQALAKEYLSKLLTLFDITYDEYVESLEKLI